MSHLEGHDGPISGMLRRAHANFRLPALKLSQVDLNLLVALDALLRERNVTLAGKRIGLGQPAMSAALARLRDMFQDGSRARLQTVAQPGMESSR